MRRRNTLLSASILILLGAYVYFFELQKEGKGKTERLLDFKQDEVESVTLIYPEQEIRIKKAGSGKWQISHPLEAAADESAVSGILSALSTSEITRTVEKNPTAEDLRTFGLDQPKVKVQITLSKGKALPMISLGGKTAVGNSAYAKRGSESSVLLTGAALSSNLEKKLTDLRNKKIMELKPDAVKQLALKGTKGEFVLSKMAEGWYLEKPKSYRADQTEISGILSSLGGMSARDFFDETPLNLKKYGLDPPRFRVTVTLEDKTGEREILFGNKREESDEVYLVLDSRGTVYSVEESVLQGFDKELFDLRDKEIFPFPGDQVSKVQIHTPKESWLLVKGEKEEWEVEVPKKGTTRQGAVPDYLTALGRLRAKRLVEEEAKNIKKYGLDQPSLKVSLGGTSGKSLGNISLGNKIGGEYYAKRDGSPAIYTIEEFSFNQLNKQLSDFFEAEKKETKGPPAPQTATKK